MIIDFFEYGSSAGLNIVFLTAEQTDENGVPTISNPDTKTIYLAKPKPIIEEGSNLYNEWVWLKDNNAWELFGSAGINFKDLVRKVNEVGPDSTGNVTVTTNQKFLDSFVTDETTNKFCESVVQNGQLGMSYMGALTCTDLPSSLQNAEAIVSVINTSLSTTGKVIHIYLYSTTTSPYAWEYNYYKAGSVIQTSGWLYYDSYTKAEEDAKLALKEDKANKVTSWSETVTDTNYPSEKLVKGSLDGKANNATSLSGYGITDANIVDGVITLGSNTITPLTEHQDISGKENIANKVTEWSETNSDTNYPSEKLVKDSLDGKADKATSLSGYGITDAYTKGEVDSALSEKANKVDTLSANDTDKGVKVTLGGSVETPTLDVEVTEGSISTGNTSVITGGTVYAVTSDLQTQINNLKGIGRFLSTWNAVTGKPGDDPTTTPYTYKVGDYYIIGNIATSGETNYRPAPILQYNGDPSTIEEIEEILVGDCYFCTKVDTSSTTWILLNNSKKTVTFSEIAGEVKDNTKLKNAFETADIADSSDSGVKVSLTGTVENHGITVEVTPGTIASGNTSVVTGGDVYTELEKKADTATTLEGYNITDAKIENGVITLGDNSITPVTSVNNILPTNGNVTVNTFSALPEDIPTTEELTTIDLCDRLLTPDPESGRTAPSAGQAFLGECKLSDPPTKMDNEEIAIYVLGNDVLWLELSTTDSFVTKGGGIPGKWVAMYYAGDMAMSWKGLLTCPKDSNNHYVPTNDSDGASKYYVDTEVSGKANKTDTLSANDTDKGVKVTLGGTIGTPTIDVEVTKGTIASGDTSVVTGGDVYTALQDKADKGDKLSDYGIDDAKIVNGVITLGDNSITPLTSHQDISGKEDKANIVTTFQSTPDDTHYPSEKLVKDSLDEKAGTNDVFTPLVSETITETKSVQLDSNKYYVYTLNAGIAVTITLNSPTLGTIVNDYSFEIHMPASGTVPTINLPNFSWFGGSAPTFSLGKVYQISVLNNLAVSAEFNAPTES